MRVSSCVTYICHPFCVMVESGACRHILCFCAGACVWLPSWFTSLTASPVLPEGAAVSCVPKMAFLLVIWVRFFTPAFSLLGMVKFCHTSDKGRPCEAFLFLVEHQHRFRTFDEKQPKKTGVCRRVRFRSDCWPVVVVDGQ